MSRGITHAVSVGNDFVLPRRSLLKLAEPIVTSQPVIAIASIPIEAISQQESIQVIVSSSSHTSTFSQLLNFMHHYSLGTFALLILLVGSTGVSVAGRYWSAKILSQTKPIAITKPLTHTITGFSLAVPNSKLQAELQTITSQPANISVGTQTVSISPDVIKSWLKITPSGNGAQDYIQVNADSINNSLKAIANQYVVAPVNEVSVTHTDSVTPSGVILPGRNGASLSDLNSLVIQTHQSAKSVMDAQGLQFSTPLQTVPFQSVTPAAFGKLLETDVNTHRLYAYENGQLVNSFLISAGAPATPTPIGEFHIWEKLTSQTMTGFNPNGTPYVQPNVPWINYFDHRGDAVHGNYWRPASAFGYVNTSHGCVGVQVSQAEWVYDWAPIGTTVINHT